MTEASPCRGSASHRIGRSDQPERGEQEIDDAVLVGIEPFPQERRGDVGNDPRDEEQGAKEAAAVNFHVEQEGERKRRRCSRRPPSRPSRHGRAPGSTRRSVPRTARADNAGNRRTPSGSARTMFWLCRLTMTPSTSGYDVEQRDQDQGGQNQIDKRSDSPVAATLNRSPAGLDGGGAGRAGAASGAARPRRPSAWPRARRARPAPASWRRPRPG